MRARRHLAPGIADTFDLITHETSRSFVANITERVDAAAVPISLMTLLAAIVVVTNTSLVSVTQRIREIGIRRALGASAADVLWLVARSAASVVLGGALLGGGVSLAATRVLSSVLYGVSPVDPVTLAAVTLLLGLAAVAAVAGPAWRAARIDPAAVLRGQ